MAARGVIALLALACLPVLAVESPAWPPPEGVATRMRELQGVLSARDSSAVQREAAREELSGLLKSPAGQARGRATDEKPTRPARAAVDVVPTTVIPAPHSPLSMPGVARIEVIDPPKARIDLRSSIPAAPAGPVSFDPRTGNMLHEIPGGAIDPRTGRLTPR